MSKPYQRIRGPLTARYAFGTTETLIASPNALWVPVAGLPGYVRSADGRLAREIKVRTNKNGTRWAGVMRGGKQTVIRL